MVTYPVHIARVGYRGNDPKKRAKLQATNELTGRIEAYVNERLKNQVEPIRMYTYHEISAETGIDYESVTKIGYGIDGGSGGFTAYRSDLTQEQAMSLASQGKRS